MIPGVSNLGGILRQDHFLIAHLLTSNWVAIQSLGPYHPADNQAEDEIVGQNINTGVTAEDQSSEDDSQHPMGDSEHRTEDEDKKDNKAAEVLPAPGDCDIESIVE